MIACVGIVAKENSPLLLRVFPQVDEEDTKFHHICYCSLDVFEEREQAMRATAGGGARQIDTFLGVLYLVQDYKVYGYVTNTGVRFILVVDDSDNKDASMTRALFRKLHNLFTETVSNPFYKQGQPLSSKKLDTDLDTLVRLWNTDALVQQ